MGIFDSLKHKAAGLAHKAKDQGGAKNQAGGSQDMMSKGMQQAGDMANKATGDRYSSQVDKGVDVAQQRFGGADEAARTDPGQQS